MSMHTYGLANRSEQHHTKMAASAVAYTKFVLSIYDRYVIQFSNSFVWQCPSARILEVYNQHVSANHLDIGVGTGYFLDHCRFPTPTPRIALLDLNPNTLDTTYHRLQRYQPETYVGDVLEPIALPSPGFDSIGLNYVLHCLAGDMSHKSAVFQNLRPLLNPNGVLFGSTILGEGVPHNFLARKLRQGYNARGIFGNRHDNVDDLDAALAANFTAHAIEIRGCVALFHATG